LNACGVSAALHLVFVLCFGCLLDNTRSFWTHLNSSKHSQVPYGFHNRKHISM
jgi:hypothetical protein